MKTFIDTHLGMLLALAAVLGLLLPGGDRIPSQTIIVLLGIVILLSCLRSQGGDFAVLDFRGLLAFWLSRFVVLPVLMYGVALVAAPDYAPAVLLLGLTPAGTSSAGFTGLFGGNVVAALFLTLVSSGAAIALIPLAFSIAGISGATPPPLTLMMALAQCVLIPSFLAIPLRRVKIAVAFSHRWGKTLAVLLLTLMVFVIIAGQRGNILRDPAELPVPLLVAALCYAAFVAAGMLVFRTSPANRIAALTCSAYNNSGLSLALVLTGFAPKVVMTIVMAEVVWSLLPVATRHPVARFKRNLDEQIY